jgi:hypothetical protein
VAQTSDPRKRGERFLFSLGDHDALYALEIVRRLALAPAPAEKLRRAGAIGLLLRKAAHKNASIAINCAAAARLLLSGAAHTTAAAAAAATVPEGSAGTGPSAADVAAVLAIDVKHTHPICRVELARALAAAAKLPGADDALHARSTLAFVGFLLTSKHAALHEEACEAIAGASQSEGCRAALPEVFASLDALAAAGFEPAKALVAQRG